MEATHQCGKFCGIRGIVNWGIAYCHGVPMIPILKELDKLKELVVNTMKKELVK